MNELATELGLMTSFGTGRQNKDLSIRFTNFELPNAPGLRVDYSDDVGPVTCEIKNNSSDAFNGKLGRQNNSTRQ